MMYKRNPFLLRASEDAGGDELFVRLFHPDVLRILETADLEGGAVIFRSAPGGGKSSLLRVFTPGVLRLVWQLRRQQDVRDLHLRLSELRAIGDKGPQLLGILHSCSRGYATLEDLDLSEGRGRACFFALLNARLLLAFIRGAAETFGVDHPTGLQRLQLLVGEVPETLRGLSTGRVLDLRHIQEWSSGIERTIYESLDSLSPINEGRLVGHTTLAVLDLLAGAKLLLDGQEVALRILVMLDDVHQLGASQRRSLLEESVLIRKPVAIWLSERSEVLKFDELVGQGAMRGRDYRRVLDLEDYWRTAQGAAKFERFVLGVADRRIHEGPSIGVQSFSGCIVEEPEHYEYEAQMAAAAHELERRVTGRFGSLSRYESWLSAAATASGNSEARALSWRTTEILIERDVRRSQHSFDFALSESELLERSSSGLVSAGRLFIAKEFDLPYYYGSRRLAAAASANIHQFLRTASQIYEEVVAATIVKRPPALSPYRQDELLRKIAAAEWQHLPERLPRGHTVRGFIDALCRFCVEETYQPTAPYSPGVTGIAISMADRDKLLALPSRAGTDHDLHDLTSVLATAISANLLEVILDYRCKGRNWMLLYLNRELCVHYFLPLQRGGWRERTLKELAEWMRVGFRNRTGGTVAL